jgi:CheY-like chemotaxis protein
MALPHIVLIVDDEPVGRETLEALLLAEGYQLAFAANGPEALAQAAALNPDRSPSLQPNSWASPSSVV